MLNNADDPVIAELAEPCATATTAVAGLASEMAGKRLLAAAGVNTARK
eukprot:SAG31_NODE_8089_length_1524_cov_2.932632_2_plen_48_part_00